MHFSVEYLEPTKVKLSVEVDASALARAKNAALLKLARSVTVPGYRIGKAPLSAAEKRIDPNLLSEETLQTALSENYGQALLESQLRPVSNPEVSVKAYVPYQKLTFEAVTEVIGKIKLGKYKGLTLKPETALITKADIDSVVSRLQKQLAKRTPLKRAAAVGDEVIIDFSGKYADSGELISGASGKDYPLELGSESFIPGFESKLIGAKPEEQKEVKLTFPKNYQATFLRGKEAIFDVKVKSVSSLDLPKLDDSFAKLVGPFKLLAELKADIKRELKANKDNELELAYQNQLLEQIAKASSVDIPSALIEDETARLERDLRQNAAYRGQTWEEYLISEGLSEAGFKEQALAQASQRVKAGLVLGEIAKEESIKVEPNEVDARISALKQQYANDQAMLGELDKEQNRDDLKNRIMVEKTIQRLKSLNP